MDALLSKSPYFAVFYGKKFAGKSNLISLVLLDSADQYDQIYVWTFTKITKFYQEHGIPEDNIFDELSEKTIKPILTEIMEEFEDNKNYRTLLVFDDILGGDKSIRYLPSLTRIATLGRHFNITCIMGTQQVTGIPPAIRNNAEIVLIMNVRRSEINELVKIYCPREIDQETFKNFIVNGIKMGEKDRTFIMIEDKKDLVTSVTIPQSPKMN